MLLDWVVYVCTGVQFVVACTSSFRDLNGMFVGFGYVFGDLCWRSRCSRGGWTFLRRAGGSFRGVSGCGVVPAGIKWDSRRRCMGYVMLGDKGGVPNRRRVATTSAVIFLCVTIA